MRGLAAGLTLGGASLALQAQVPDLPAIAVQTPDLPALHVQIPDLPAIAVKVPDLPALHVQIPDLPAIAVKVPDLPALQVQIPDLPALQAQIPETWAPEPGATPPAPRAGGGARVEMPITINITAPPGTDAHALAALVRREVAQATHQAAGRIARLYDVSDGL